MTMKIEIQPSVPPMLIPIIKERIDTVLYLFPAWCTKLVVTYSYAADDVMSCDVQYEYRTFILHIHPNFLEDVDWQHSLIHEVGHGILKPVIQFGDKLIEHFVNDDQMTKFLLDQFAYLEEQVTEDIALFGQKLRDCKTVQKLSGADEKRASKGQANARRGVSRIPKKS